MIDRRSILKLFGLAGTAVVLPNVKADPVPEVQNFHDYKGFKLHWTGWKTSYHNLEAVGQWVATKADPFCRSHKTPKVVKERDILVIKDQYECSCIGWISSAPGELKKLNLKLGGETFDISPRLGQVRVGLQDEHLKQTMKSMALFDLYRVLDAQS